MKNWRPLTLLDVIYKIASGTIANRLKSVLDTLIDKDQTGFLKGRYIGENTRLIYDVMNYTEQNNIPGLLLLIDFEKAFDSVSWVFIQKVLKFLNFGPEFCRWIETFYCKITSSVIQYGHMSEFFNIGRGCRQGDPLSPYIFILCAEFLAVKIRQNKNISGIKIKDLEFKISQYADDTSMFLDGSSESLIQALNELDRFANISGLKINYEKTQVVWIGSKKYSTNSIKTKWKLSWGSKTFKVLGIIFNVNLEQMIKDNYITKIEHLKSNVTRWGKRALTPIGKITVIKTFMVSAFNHLFLALPNPNQRIINYINNTLFDFLWNNKTSKIKKTVIVKQHCEGGLQMINLNAFIEALKSTWIRRLLLNDGKWQDIIKLDIEIDKLAGCNTKYAEKCIANIKNEFWKDVLQSFINVNKKKLISENNILQTPIFYNENIKIGGSHIFYCSWYKKGIRFFNDLIKESGDFYTHEEFTEISGIQSNTIQFHGTLRAIKIYLKEIHVNITHKTKMPFIPSHIQPFLTELKGSKTMYDLLNENKDVPTGQITWNKIYDLSKDDWAQIYNYPFNITKYPALLWFQVSINHNILVTNKLLHQMKIQNDSLCTFCKLNIETTTHLLWKCTLTQNFVRELLAWLNSYGIICNISEESFIFGKQEGRVFPKAINFILLYAKYFIYISRCKQQPLILNIFKKKLQ
ncbi:MAG: reverse transcriptase family protein, partial [Candidatus Thiodiazotropha endolucinida]|nr:reverse transcriptase family protein [Candidatus Thiodiazotropha taylori]MCW4271719.1 reverse transcriptase family protein [Candidatus Thiodiazotropha endolucinida]